MASTTKILDICDSMNLVCIRNNKTNINPYRLYLFYSARDRYEYPTKHRKMLAEYSDFHSVICHINDMYKAGIEKLPIESILAWNKQYYNPYSN